MVDKEIKKIHIKLFDEIKQYDEHGVEFWSARDLQIALGYQYWNKFLNAINNAKEAFVNSDLGLDVSVAFRPEGKNYKSKNRFGEFEGIKEDFHLSRYACYLIAQNGNARIPEIAKAQSYFAIQTYRQEQMDGMNEEEKRFYIRSQVNKENKRLHKAAQDSGVQKFGTFYDAGYLGLYGMRAKQIKAHKNLGKDNILDRAGSGELAANLFRITQTQDKLQRELESGKQIGDRAATNTHFMVGGKVRQTIKDIGGTLPEDLPAEENIKQLEQKIKEEDARPLQPSEKPLKITTPFDETMKKIVQIAPLDC